MTPYGPCSRTRGETYFCAPTCSQIHSLYSLAIRALRSCLTLHRRFMANGASILQYQHRWNHVFFTCATWSEGIPEKTDMASTTGSMKTRSYALPASASQMTVFIFLFCGDLRESNTSTAAVILDRKLQSLRKAHVVKITTSENTTNNTTCCGVLDVVKITTSCGVFY